MAAIFRHILSLLREGNTRSLSFVRLITWMIVVALLPILAVSTISYVQVSQTFRQEAAQTSEQYVSQTINALEIIVRQIMDSCRQLALNPTFRRFEWFPNGDYYENLTGEIAPGDLSEHYRYYVEKERAMDSVTMFRLSNPFIDSLYFYDSRQNKVLAFGDRFSAGTFHRFDTFYDQAWRPRLNREGLPAPIIMDARRAVQQDGLRKSVLTVIMPTGTNDNAFIVNLDLRLLYGEVLSRLSGDGAAYVLSEEGKVILHERDDALNQPVRSFMGEEVGQVVQGTHGSFNLTLGGVPSLAVFATSGLLGWKMLHIVPLEGLHRSLNSLRQVILYTGAVMLLLAGMMAYLSSRRLYRPVQKTMEERDLYRDRLEETLPVFRERFAYSLLRPNKYTERELRAKLAELQVPLGRGPYEVLIVEAAPAGPPESAEALEADVLQLQLRELAEAAASAAGCGHLAVMSDECQLTLVLWRTGLRPDGEGAGRRTAERLQALAAVQGVRGVRLGFGGGCPSLKELPQAYAEARESLRSGAGGGGRPQTDGAESEADAAVFPQAKAVLLCDYIRVGDAGQALKVLETFLADVLKRTGPRREPVRAILVQLLSFMQHTLYDRTGKADRPPGPGGEERMYRELLALDGFEAMQAWFADRIRAAAKDFEDGEQEDRKRHHVERMQQIIESNLTGELSLSATAEELGLNPAYVSRLFKQTTGQTFMEYVTAVRIERSKALLTRTELKVGDIGREVGYSQDYYFIRLFKEHTGVTPGEYRRRMRGGS